MFDKIQRTKSDEKILGSQTRGSADVPENKAARSSMSAALTEKVSAGFSSSDALGDMFKHLRTGSAANEVRPKDKAKPKPNRNKKVLTPEQQQQKDFEKSLEKMLGFKSTSIFLICFLYARSRSGSETCLARRGGAPAS